MDLSDIPLRIWADLTARPDGPLAFRFVVQPVVASLLAVRDGLRDGQEDGPTFLVTLLTGRSDRGALLRDAFGTIGRLLLVALVLDCAYQLIVLRALFPGEALVVAFVFGFLPYAVARGVIARIVRVVRKFRR